MSQSSPEIWSISLCTERRRLDMDLFTKVLEVHSGKLSDEFSVGFKGLGFPNNSVIEATERALAGERFPVVVDIATFMKFFAIFSVIKNHLHKISAWKVQLNHVDEFLINLNVLFPYSSSKFSISFLNVGSFFW